MLDVQALPDAAQFDVQVALNTFYRDVFAAVAFGVVDFAEAPGADATFDRVSFERSRANWHRKPWRPPLGLLTCGGLCFFRIANAA